MKKSDIAGGAIGAGAIACIVSLVACNGSETRTRCLPDRQLGTVVRTAPLHEANSRDEAVSVAIRLKSGVVVTCAGGSANTAMGVGDVVDGKSLHSYRVNN